MHLTINGCHVVTDRDSQGRIVVRLYEDQFRTLQANAELLAALEYIVNDAEPGEDARLTVEGYNRACAAIAAAKGVK